MFDSNVLHIAEFMTVAKSLPHLLQKVRKLLIPKLFLSYSCILYKKIFSEESVVIRRDPSKTQFVARLNDFYFQFQRIGNNYNQIVKVINMHFTNIAIPHQIAALGQRTRELKVLSIEILTSCGMVANIRSGASPPK